MSLNESIVEDVALIMPAATLIPTLSHGEKEKREAIRRLNPAIPEEASACARHADRRATIRDYRIVRFERSLP